MKRRITFAHLLGCSLLVASVGTVEAKPSTDGRAGSWRTGTQGHHR